MPLEYFAWTDPGLFDFPFEVSLVLAYPSTASIAVHRLRMSPSRSIHSGFNSFRPVHSNKDRCKPSHSGERGNVERSYVYNPSRSIIEGSFYFYLSRE